MEMVAADDRNQTATLLFVLKLLVVGVDELAGVSYVCLHAVEPVQVSMSCYLADCLRLCALSAQFSNMSLYLCVCFV